MGCEALATKAELQALESKIQSLQLQLNSKLDKAEKQSVIQATEAALLP